MSKIEVNTIEPQCGTTLTVGAAGTTVTVPSNVVKSNALQAADGGNIVSQSGTTITLGATGDSINLAAGATQSGFGRTGTVDWDTTAKTASFTAVSGNGYFVNTTSVAITVTLPASPSAGDIVAVSDYAQTSATNNITIARNGSNIEGDASDLVIKNDGVALTFVYADATKGWKVVNAGAESNKDPTPQFIEATGGTETFCGDFKIHTFTGPGTFTVSSVGNAVGSNTVDYLVVAGGGGGGTGDAGGGGGAGGYRESSGSASGDYTVSPLGSCVSALPVSIQGYSIVIGGGGAGGGPQVGLSGADPGSSGSNSVFSTITSTAGGGGGEFKTVGLTGGSGGGAGGRCGFAGGAGNTPPVAPSQGNNGGTSNPSTSAINDAGGGGGGATAAGTNGATPAAGPGGAGATSSINGTPTARAGGGGGGACGSRPAGTGGSGGGGAGGTYPCASNANGTPGTINTGGGGGGVGVAAGPSSGGSGGSGIVIIRYKFQ